MQPSVRDNYAKQVFAVLKGSAPPRPDDARLTCWPPATLREMAALCWQLGVGLCFLHLPASTDGFLEDGCIFVRLSSDKEKMLFVVIHEAAEEVLRQNPRTAHLGEFDKHSIAGRVERLMEAEYRRFGIEMGFKIPRRDYGPPADISTKTTFGIREKSVQEVNPFDEYVIDEPPLPVTASGYPNFDPAARSE
jgi:hypothetical protein